MTKPLTKEELSKIKWKYAEKKIYNVIDSQRNNNSSTLSEEEQNKEIVKNNDGCPELEHLSSKEDSVMKILDVLSKTDDKKKMSITDIDWKKVKII